MQRRAPSAEVHSGGLRPFWGTVLVTRAADSGPHSASRDYPMTPPSQEDSALTVGQPEKGKAHPARDHKPSGGEPTEGGRSVPSASGKQFWEYEHPVVQLRWELRAYRDFLNRDGKSRSSTGRRRRKRIRQLASEVEENRG